MHLRNLKLENIEEAAQLHFRSLDDISSILGLNYVNKLYQILLKNPDIHQAIGFFVGKKLVGLIITSHDLQATQKLIHNIININFIITLIIKLITIQVSLIRIVERYFFEKKLSKISTGKFEEIIIICVDKDWQRKGVGRQLVNQQLRLSKQIRCKTIFVDTRKENITAIEFYKRNGFKVFASFFGSVVLKKTIS